MHKASPKRVSQERWEQNNYLARTIARTLRTPTHAAALWMMFTYATPKGDFEMSAGLLAELLGVSHRTAQRIIQELRDDGVIKYADGEPNVGFANRFRITFKPPVKVRH